MARKKINGAKKRKKIMRQKLVVMICFILLAFGVLVVRLYLITKENQDTYQKKILSQQKYDSSTIPYKRGAITDTNGTILAVSEKVYNVILDCKVMLDDAKNQDPTVSALAECFGLDKATLNQFIKDNPKSQYKVLKKKLTYEEISPFLEKKATHNEMAKKNKEKTIGIISGVWFEEEYIRRYPNGTLACDVIGFTGSDNNGTYGLEEYYNSELNGTNGREYGYLNDDGTLERTTVAAVDGNSLVSTIDANIQSIVEKYILQFNEEHKNEYREGEGAKNIGVIAMNPNNGEVLAMASYPNFDLNNPKDLTAYYTEEQITAMQEENTYYDALNTLWRNFCISDTYEPGSTAKALTLATGLETGKISGNETYECTGKLQVADRIIKCNARGGHGVLDVSGAIEQSCNVALMEMGQKIGVTTMLKFNNIFNIGLKTNIDLAGEARTANLVFNEQTMRETELATSSFGQGFNVTMIEMATAFSAVINGGYYYEPHMVSKIVNSQGDVVRHIEPRVLKQAISSTTSEKMRAYLYAAVAEGTGASARPAGYAIGGKTGTAEKVPRGQKNYVLSFIGFAPADNPEIVLYVVVDEPNVEKQDSARYATGIAKNILTEVLPYLHIPKTEEMTIGEQIQVEEILGMTQEGVQATYIVDPITGELIDPETGEPAVTQESLAESEENNTGQE